MENLVVDVLKRFKITPLYRGYDYMIDAVKITLNDNSCLRYVTKQIYPEIAKVYKTDWKNVERDIRTVIDVIWKNGGKDFFYESAGEYLEKRPRNARFIEMMVEYVMETKLSQDRKVQCRHCVSIKKLESKVKILEGEIERLDGTIKLMNDLILTLKKNK